VAVAAAAIHINDRGAHFGFHFFGHHGSRVGFHHWGHYFFFLFCLHFHNLADRAADFFVADFHFADNRTAHFLVADFDFTDNRAADFLVANLHFTAGASPAVGGVVAAVAHMVAVVFVLDAGMAMVVSAGRSAGESSGAEEGKGKRSKFTNHGIEGDLRMEG
jgi:hypothetical protein